MVKWTMNNYFLSAIDNQVILIYNFLNLNVIFFAIYIFKLINILFSFSKFLNHLNLINDLFS